jgi:chromosome partitioning protein
MRQLISNKLRRLVRADSRYARGDRRAHVLAVSTVKGGVGKTTTSVNLACAAASKGLRVLLVDLDAQGHCWSSLSARVPSHPVARPVSELLLDDSRAQLLDAAVSTQIPGLDLTPADPALAEAEGRLSQKIGKELLLRDALSITRTHYDLIVLDCPPNKGNLTLNALLAADQVLIPTDLSPLATQGADELISTVVTVNERLHHPLDILGVVLTRVDGRNISVNDAVRADLIEAWGDLVLSTEIGVNTKLSQAQLEGLPVFEFAPKSRGALHYQALADEVLSRLESSAQGVA